MILTMRDSVNPHAIPTDTNIVCGYADGFYKWTDAEWALFPNSIRLTIATNANTQADILDVEKGDATPAQAAEWCNRFNRPSRRRPTIYCNRSTWPAVRSALAGRVVDYWISTLDGTQYIPGAVAVQYKDFGAYDASYLSDYSWVMNLMDINIARSFIWINRLMYFGPSALSEPNAQAAIDSYASRMANGENPEGVLSSMFSDAQKDGRLNPFFKVT